MIHNKQFIIAQYKFLYNETWESLELPNGYILSYQKNLHITTSSDYSIILIGDAWQVNESAETPSYFVSRHSANEPDIKERIIEEENSWNGRYILLVGNFIYLDAVGTLGVFYSANAISSSIRILCDAEQKPITYPDNQRGVYPDFTPGPLTHIDGIKRLLPSQIYDYQTHTLMHRRFWAPIPETMHPEQIHEVLDRLFRTSLTNMCAHYQHQPVWIALTGGKDSRTALALFEKNKIPYSLYTFAFSESSNEDNAVAKQLAHQLNKDHLTIECDKSCWSETREKEYKEHTMLMNVDADQLFYVHSMYHQLAKEAGGEFLMLRNNVWETIMNYYKYYYSCSRHLVRKLRANGKYSRSIDEWLKWVKEDPYKNQISMWNRIFWEQREGCWLSSIEQSLDIMDNMTCVQICNCREILAYLHAYPLPMREKKLHNIAFINYICPQCNELPYGQEKKRSIKDIIMKQIKGTFAEDILINCR